MPQTQLAKSVPDRPTATDDQIRETVVGLIADVLDITPDDVGDDGRSLLDLGAESLMFVEVVLKLESAYGIRIDRSYALPGPHLIGDYIAAVRGGLAEKRQGPA
jgi:acyl carrier protein